MNLRGARPKHILAGGALAHRFAACCLPFLVLELWSVALSSSRRGSLAITRLAEVKWQEATSPLRRASVPHYPGMWSSQTK